MSNAAESLDAVLQEHAERGLEIRALNKLIAGQDTRIFMLGQLLTICIKLLDSNKIELDEQSKLDRSALTALGLICKKEK